VSCQSRSSTSTTSSGPMSSVSNLLMASISTVLWLSIPNNIQIHLLMIELVLAFVLFIFMLVLPCFVLQPFLGE